MGAILPTVEQRMGMDEMGWDTRTPARCRRHFDTMHSELPVTT